jgi:hypothetical protein
MCIHIQNNNPVKVLFKIQMQTKDFSIIKYLNFHQFFIIKNIYSKFNYPETIITQLSHLTSFKNVKKILKLK